MAPRASHESRGLVLRRGRFGFDVEIWQDAATKSLDFIDCLPVLLPAPAWTGTERQASFGSKYFTVEGVSVPPAVYFQRAAELKAISLCAVILKTGSLQGLWVTASQFLDQADEQWQAVVHGLLSQVQYALSTGFLTLPRDTSAARDSVAKSTPSAPPPTAQKPDALPPVAQLTAHSRETSNFAINPEAHTSDPIEGGEQSDEAESSGTAQASTFAEGLRGTPAFGCSGYPQGSPPGSESDNDTEDAKFRPPQPQEDAAPKPVAVWQAGEVCHIGEGGRDVQAVLDSDNLQLGVVSWHAAWIEACLDVTPFMQRLAQKFRGVGIMQLDVETSMANKVLAYEKVLTRSESRRRGAKPVVKNAQHFPCITLHHPSDLTPAQTFCGKSAIDRLAEALMSFGPDLMLHKDGAEASPSRGIPQPQSAFKLSEPRISRPIGHATPSHVGNEDSAQASASHTAGEPQPAKNGHEGAENWRKLQKGAMEFRQVLQQAKATGQDLVVVWISGDAGKMSHIQEAAKAHASQMFLQADVTLHKDNRQLATSLHIKNFPLVQVYSGMKKVADVNVREAANGNLIRAVKQALSTVAHPAMPAVAELPEQPKNPLRTDRQTGGETQAQPEASSSSLELKQDGSTSSSSPALEDVRVSSLQKSASSQGSSLVAGLRGCESKDLETLPSVTEGSSNTGDSEGSPRDTTFDPPGKYTKTGAKKRLPKGLAIFWPKMPCLRCGSPWWLGEDWDAKCARCSWSAENDGYDDDSKPLPKFQKNYEYFSQLIKEGRTADYPT